MPDISDSLWLGAEYGAYPYFQNESGGVGQGGYLIRYRP